MNALSLVAFLIFALCGAFPMRAEEKPRILATFAPIYCFTANVAGDNTEVSMLLSESAGPHDFALSPSDLRKLSRADIIVKNGLGVETWLDKAIAASTRQSVPVIDSSRGIATLPVGEPIRSEGDDREHEHGHEAGAANPHIWLDPLRAVQQVENIRDGLVSEDPDHAADYRQNAAEYVKRLKALDTWIKEQFAGMSRPAVISSHDAVDYFAQRYGLNVVAVFASQPGADPSPRLLKELRDRAREADVRVFLTEPQYSPRLMESLARELGVKVISFDTMETGVASRELYERTMRANVEALVPGLHRK